MDRALILIAALGVVPAVAYIPTASFVSSKIIGSLCLYLHQAIQARRSPDSRVSLRMASLDGAACSEVHAVHSTYGMNIKYLFRTLT